MLRTAASLVLIFILAFTGVKIWYNRLENAMLSAIPPEKAVEAGAVEKKVEIKRRKDDYQVVINRNIFGAALEKIVEQPKPEPVVELQPTKLKLSLMGTVSGSEKDSRAIIADETNKKQDIYAVGDTVQGAMIKSIERRRVVLRVNGRDEILNIKEREGGPAEPMVIEGPAHAERRSLRDRLSARPTNARPAAVNRPLRVITPPDAAEENQFEGGVETDEFIEEFPDQVQEQDVGEPQDLEPMDQEQPPEPEYLDNEPIDDPELTDEEQYR